MDSQSVTQTPTTLFLFFLFRSVKIQEIDGQNQKLNYIFYITTLYLFDFIQLIMWKLNRNINAYLVASSVTA